MMKKLILWNILRRSYENFNQGRKLMFTEQVLHYYRVNEFSICNSTSIKYLDIFNVLHDFDDYFIQNENIFNMCKINYDKYKFFTLNLSYNNTPFEYKPKFLKMSKSYLGREEFKRFLIPKQNQKQINAYIKNT